MLSPRRQPPLSDSTVAVIVRERFEFGEWPSDAVLLSEATLTGIREPVVEVAQFSLGRLSRLCVLGEVLRGLASLLGVAGIEGVGIVSEGASSSLVRSVDLGFLFARERLDKGSRVMVRGFGGRNGATSMR